MTRALGKLLPQNTFARSVSVLVGGTASAQALMVLASPLLTRLYTPEDFGFLAVYGGLLALFSVVSSLRYELAIPLAETNAEAANVTILSLLIVLLMTVISGLMVFLAGDQIALVLDTPKLASFFWLLPLGVLLSGIYKVFNYWAVRTKAFGDIAKTRISQTLATLTIQLLGYKLGGIALLFGQAGGQGVGSLRLARSALKTLEFSSWSWAEVWVAAKRYKQFPIFSTWSGLFNTAGTQLPPLMFAAFFSAGAAGMYALANRILKLPITLIGGAIGQVYFSGLRDAKRKGVLASKIEKGATVLVKLSFPAGLVFMLFAPELFAWVFGAEWRIAGEVARWMIPWILFQFISSPLSVIYFVMEKERLGLIFQAGMLLTRSISLLVGYIYFDFMGSLMLFASVSAICYFLYSLSIFIIVGADIILFIKSLLLELFKVSVLLCLIVFFYGFNFYFSVFASFLGLVAFYAPRLRLFYLNGIDA